MCRLSRYLLIALIFAGLVSVNAICQQNTGADNDSTVEGTVTSFSRQILVVRTDQNQYQLFTYGPGATHPKSLAQGARVRVDAGPADESGARSASDVTVLSAASGADGTASAAGTPSAAGTASGGATSDKGAQAAPVPAKVRNLEGEIRRESRRWRLGVEAGEAFNPELFLFGVQSQMGPIFHSRVLFRPNAEFAFGEVTDMIALNLEGIYRFSPAQRRGNWTPFVGAGPALNFIHQSYDKGRDINFGNFDYETGFNVLAGVQNRRGTFVELKTSLYSQPAPVLRLIVGYTF